MLHLHDRALISALSFCCILLPAVAFSQVTIKEKIEIKPKAPAATAASLDGQVSSAVASDRFYHPPLSVFDQLSAKGGLPLASTLTIGGSVNIDGDMLDGWKMILLDVGAGNQEHRIAWKIRSSDGVMDEGANPYSGTFAQGPYPDVRLYLFDYTWWNGTLTYVCGEDALTYNFTGSLSKSLFDPLMPVTATAIASGSQLPSSLFDGWRIVAQNMVVSGSASTLVDIRPLNAAGGVYVPWGIPRTEAEMTVRVDTVGPYVFLRWNQLSGQEITMPLGRLLFGQYSWNQPRLWYDPSKGTFVGPSKTVYVTVTGGGISTTIPVLLTKVTTCAKVTFAKTILAPGETTTLEITKEDGSPFASTEALDVEIMAGAGTLHSSSGSGTSLTNAHPPVSYTAPESIEGDSLIVQVAAYGYYSGEGGASASLAPALKKVTGIVSTQSVSPRSDPAGLERIGRLLANNACSAGEAVVKSEALDHFAVTASPTTITHSESAQVTVLALDVNGKEVEIDGSTSMTFAASPADYGALQPSTGITYAVAKNGGVKYIANGTNPSGPGSQGVTLSVSALNKSGAAVIRVSRKCEQTVNTCSEAQLQPETFSSANVNVFSEGQTFTGKDVQGKPLTASVNGCAYNPLKENLAGRVGLTVLIPKIPFDGAGPQSYRPLSDDTYDVSMCVDGTGRWVFSPNNVVVPLFMSYCPNRVDFKEFLGDGTDQNLIEMQIPDKKTYDKIIDELETYWMPGPYDARNKDRKPMYVFPAGIMAHESHHYRQNLSALQESFNDAFLSISQFKDATTSLYPCPEDALKNKGRTMMRTALNGAWSKAAADRSKEEKLAREQMADSHASGSYAAIRDAIKKWAETHPW